MPSPNSWLTGSLTPSVDQPHVQLIAFPHAGGSAASFRSWNDLPSEVDVVAVQYPGRGPRHTEPPCTKLDELCDAVIDALRPTLESGLPFAFFGHSFGSLAAVEVAKKLASRGLPVPIALLLSAHPAPGVALDDTQVTLSQTASDEVRRPPPAKNNFAHRLSPTDCFALSLSLSLSLSAPPHTAWRRLCRR
jgi:surfactin synthase thioesterase subunit